jgi:uncharacterized protein (TIGR03435 family)
MDAPSPEPAGPSTPEGRDAKQKLLALRLRSLLADRFKLHVRQAVKEKPVYDLVVAKDGSKLKEAMTNTGYSEGPGHLKCSYFSMQELASTLSDHMDRVIVDQTRLPGGYAFELTWNQNDKDINTTTPGIFTALHEQLGLKLVPSKRPVETLSIDHVEMPSQN